MDVLLDPNVRGYVIGATNILFKQKKHLADILVEVSATLCSITVIIPIDIDIYFTIISGGYC